MTKVQNSRVRSEFKQGDQVIVHNIKKAKRLPGTKDTKKYLGPYTIEEVKPSHLVARKDPHSKTTKFPIHMSRKYHLRNPVTTNSKKTPKKSVNSHMYRFISLIHCKTNFEIINDGDCDSNSDLTC